MTESTDKSIKVLSAPTYASKVTVFTSANDIVINLGQSRQLLDERTGLPASAVGTEWFAAVALSPTTAQQLHQALSEAIRIYENEFGKIPTDTLSEIQTIKGN